MSEPSPPGWSAPAPPVAPPGSAFAWPPPGGPAARAAAPWAADLRRDLRSAAVTVLLLALGGLVAGLVWWQLAPRADFTVTADGIEPVGGPVSNELFMADDGVFTLVLAGLGLLAGLAVWSRRRRRGVGAVAALTIGMLAAGVVAWQLGRALGQGPSRADLADVGARVTTALDLGALSALAVGPFAAVLVYVVAATLTTDDQLRRRQPAG
ncbi:DUF2567 domain-containing protein [Modestobacter sp. NPDC049651]|uniref:DUF2567 domain-containing protein n=1 Tax=unclassified Modestobacter TaxID=2643866 RepID=UPI00340F674C